MSKKSVKVVLLAVLCALMSLGFAVPSMAARKPAKPKLVWAKATGTNIITIKWKKAKRARKYELFVSVDEGKFKKIYSGRNRSYNHEEIRGGHIYRYKVRARNGKKKSAWSKMKSVTIWKTTGDYYDDLRDIIRLGGSYDADGNAWIRSTQTSDGLKYVYAVTYFEPTSSFRFSMTIASDYDTEYAAFYVYPSTIKNKLAQIEYRSIPKYEEGSSPVELEGTLNMAAYRIGTSLNWSGTSYKEKDVNLSWKIAFAGWQELLDSTAVLNLYELGFSMIKG